MKRLVPLVFLLLGHALIIPGAYAQLTSVQIDQDDLGRLGIRTTPLAETELKRSEPALVRVLDPSPLASLEADIRAADATAAASAQRQERMDRLAAQDASVSREAAEAASAQAIADRAKAAALHRQLAINWGPQIAAMSAAERGKLLADLFEANAVLVRADLLSQAIVKPTGLQVLQTAGAPLEGNLFGPAGSADPRLQTGAFLGIVYTTAFGSLQAGRMFDGRILEDAPIKGVLLPRDAIVRLDGSDWVYVQSAAAAFERREVTDAIRVDSGWFVQNGFQIGDQIVVEGAGALLGVERTDETAEAD